MNRRDEFRASKIMLERARSTENVEWMTPYVVDEFLHGEAGSLERVRLRHVDTGETTEIEAHGAFIAIGHQPQSDIANELVAVDDAGYILTEGKSTRPTAPASSRPATSSTTPIARPSPRRAPAARPRSTPSGTCATPRRCRRPSRSRESCRCRRPSGRRRRQRPSARPSYFGTEEGAPTGAGEPENVETAIKHAIGA